MLITPEHYMPDGTLLPIVPYDFFTDSILSGVYQALIRRVGVDVASTLIVRDYSKISSVIAEGRWGTACTACGMLQSKRDATACEHCGICYQVILYIGS